MHTLEDIIKNTHEQQGLCSAIDSSQIICFNKSVAKGLCGKHYQRKRRLDSLDLEKKIKLCRFIDCNNPHKAKGYCISHYRKHVKRMTICEVNECFNTVHAKKLCRKHYERFHRYGDVNGKSNYVPRFPKGHKRRIPERTNIKCIVPRCEKDYTNNKITKGLCQNHYYKWRRYGDYNV